MGGSARPLRGTLGRSSSSSAATRPQWDKNRRHPRALMVWSAVARDLPCSATRGWGPPGTSQGLQTPALGPPAGFLAVSEAPAAAAASTKSVEPAGLCCFREKKGLCKETPSLEPAGKGAAAGARGRIYILGATRVGAS